MKQQHALTMLRDAGMIAHQQEKIDRALSSLNFDLPTMEQTIGCISIACALGYLDLRFEGAWRKNNHHLADWLSNFECHTPIYASYQTLKLKSIKITELFAAYEVNDWNITICCLID
jgi:hypothetical protein